MRQDMVLVIVKQLEAEGIEEALLTKRIDGGWAVLLEGPGDKADTLSVRAEWKVEPAGSDTPSLDHNGPAHPHSTTRSKVRQKAGATKISDVLRGWGDGPSWGHAYSIIRKNRQSWAKLGVIYMPAGTKQWRVANPAEFKRLILSRMKG